jgi:hypothetical protein
MSGQSNVVHWLQRHGLEPEPGLVDHVFSACKKADRLLTEAEVTSLVSSFPVQIQPVTSP